MAAPPRGQSQWQTQHLTATGGSDGSSSRDAFLAFGVGGVGSGKTPLAIWRRRHQQGDISESHLTPGAGLFGERAAAAWSGGGAGGLLVVGTSVGPGIGGSSEIPEGKTENSCLVIPPLGILTTGGKWAHHATKPGGGTKRTSRYHDMEATSWFRTSTRLLFDSTLSVPVQWPGRAEILASSCCQFIAGQ
eukprot:g45631.t1